MLKLQRQVAGLKIALSDTFSLLAITSFNQVSMQEPNISNTNVERKKKKKIQRNN